MTKIIYSHIVLDAHQLFLSLNHVINMQTSKSTSQFIHHYCFESDVYPMWLLNATLRYRGAGACVKWTAPLEQLFFNSV